MPTANDIQRIVQAARVLLVSNEDTFPENLGKLISHERNDNVDLRPTITHKSKVTGKTLSYKSFLVMKCLRFVGITKPMAEVVWSSYASPAVPDSKVGIKMVRGCVHGGKHKLHGTAVHKDFDRMVKVIRGNIKKKNGDFAVSNVDPCAYNILHALVKQGIVPIESEFNIYDEFSGIATAIDCLAWDTERGRIVAVEIKTGHTTQTDYMAVKGRSSFKAPFQSIQDSPLNRASAQLMLSCLIVARRYGIQIEDGIVMRPLGGGGGLQKMYLPDWTHSHEVQKKMYETLRGYVTSGQNTMKMTVDNNTNAKAGGWKAKLQAQQYLRERSKDPTPDVCWGDDVSTPGYNSRPPRNEHESIPSHEPVHSRPVICIPTLADVLQFEPPPEPPTKRWKGKGKAIDVPLPQPITEAPEPVTIGSGPETAPLYRKRKSCWRTQVLDVAL